MEKRQQRAGGSANEGEKNRGHEILDLLQSLRI
jgi:hypothetical protein